MLIGNIGVNVAVVQHVRRIFRFPDPVNETSARLVAAGVVVLAVLFLVFRDGLLLLPLVYGFAARVASGPTLSPLGQLATRVGTPWIERTFGVESRLVPGPPKRFAQLIGLTVTGGALAGWAAGAPLVTYVLLSVLLVAATLEAGFAICLGCIAYSAIWGCAGCDDISDRLRTALVESRRTVDRPAPATN